MPTILSINNYYYRRGGAEVVFLEQNRLLTEIGWRVVPFAMRHNKNLSTPWSKYFVNEIEFGEPYTLWQRLARIPKVIYSLEARRKLGRLLEAVKPDVSHVHNIYHHISPAILSLLKQRHVPTVFTVHDLKLACPAYTMLTHDGICERCRNGKLYNILIHRCVKGSLSLSSVVMTESILNRLLRSYADNVDMFIVPSRFYMKKLEDWGWDGHRLVHVPNFVDADAYRPGFSPGGNFVFFGRLGPEKGLRTFVKAVALAKVRAQIAGAGSEEMMLRRLAKTTGANVTFLGYRTGEALHQAVRSARAVVLPSESYENGPISVIESYALGKPVIGSSIGGIPELIREGETGTTFEAGSVESLALALRRFADLPAAQVREMGRVARAWVEADYTAQRYRDRLLDIYRQLGVAV